MKVAMQFLIQACGLSTLLVSGVADAAEQGWLRYVNARYRYHLCYPTTLKAQPEAPNGDGRVFHAADGGSLTVFGRNDVLHDGIDATAKDIASRLAGRGGRTSYAAGRENWRVVSGTDRAGNIFYSKILRRDDQFAIVELRYPANAPRYRLIATRISTCFAMLN